MALSALQAIPVLTATEHSGFDFTLYTGDLVAHDPDNELSRDYVRYTEVHTQAHIRLKIGCLTELNMINLDPGVRPLQETPRFWSSVRYPRKPR